MRKCIHILVFGIVTISTVYIWILQGRIAKSRAEIEALAGLIPDLESKRLIVSSLELEIAGRVERAMEEQLSGEASKDVLSEEAGPESNSMEFTGDVEAWVERVNRLSHFLYLNPKYAIAEMEMLKPHDWLSVTKEGVLATEADFRIALSRLRKKVKMRSSDFIREAWEAFDEQSDGRLLSDFSELGQFSDGRLSKDVLRRFRKMTENDVTGGMTFITSGSQLAFIDEPIDPLWGTKTQARIGGIAYSPSGVWQAKEKIEAAVEQFVSEKGREPNGSDEIAPFIESEEVRAVLPEMYRAMTTYPEL